MSLSILLVDDSHITRRFVKRDLTDILQGKDVTFVEAGSGQEALELCRGQVFDLMFLDLTMPGMTGYDLLKKLQEEAYTGKVVVLSADVQERAVERVLSLGASAFFGKPLKREQLVTYLKEKAIL